jgi:hypothetical protein
VPTILRPWCRGPSPCSSCWSSYSGRVTTGDWITLILAIATTIMAGATVWLGLWARREAIATVRLGDEAKHDRELAARPRLSAVWATGVPFAQIGPRTITLANAGAGSALGARYLGRVEDGHGLVSAAVDIAANEQAPVHAIHQVSPEVAERLLSWKSARGGEGQVAGVIVCTDVLGARHRFLMGGDAFALPVVIRAEGWTPGEVVPPWAEGDPAIWPLD